MSERLYFAYDWIAGRELLPAARAFDQAVKYGIGLSCLSHLNLLSNRFVVERIGISAENNKTLELWLAAIDGDLKRLIPINHDEFNQSEIIFSMDDEGRYLARLFYKSLILRQSPYFINFYRDAMEVHRLLRRKLRNWRVYVMVWQLPQPELQWRDPFAERVNTIVKHMYQVAHDMGGEIARSLKWQGENKQYFYLILPSYKALSLFTLRALPTLSMSVWSEISHEELPNHLETYRLQFGLYRSGLE